MNSPTILRTSAVLKRIGVSRTTLYRWLDRNSKSYDPTFPRPVSLGANSIGWLEAELDQWLEARIRASRSQEAA
ncbi:AlpA family phage regulatory protein [Burkholderia multivorans]|nr:AlpA family phage regulatory protein [Burkholderia multivorans]QGR95238.1 AlpA family phage regulatory protein [Burkholderia multivorans]HEF4735535.1 AlpA family phage regulatory protein [Burkholderia multivorans]